MTGERTPRFAVPLVYHHERTNSHMPRQPRLRTNSYRSQQHGDILSVPPEDREQLQHESKGLVRDTDLICGGKVDNDPFDPATLHSSLHKIFEYLLSLYDKPSQGTYAIDPLCTLSSTRAAMAFVLGTRTVSSRYFFDHPDPCALSAATTDGPVSRWSSNGLPQTQILLPR
jgi:hypothetical protein